LNRYQTRKNKKQAENILNKAKKDMQVYVLEYSQKTEGIPTEWELKAWQAGYVAGLNRAKAWEEA
jgi:predicted GIY-YIG superfamily endonuclease